MFSFVFLLHISLKVSYVAEHFLPFHGIGSVPVIGNIVVAQMRMTK